MEASVLFDITINVSRRLRHAGKLAKDLPKSVDMEELAFPELYSIDGLFIYCIVLNKFYPVRVPNPDRGNRVNSRNAARCFERWLVAFSRRPSIVRKDMEESRGLAAKTLSHEFWPFSTKFLSFRLNLCYFSNFQTRSGLRCVQSFFNLYNRILTVESGNHFKKRGGTEKPDRVGVYLFSNLIKILSNEYFAQNQGVVIR